MLTSYLLAEAAPKPILKALKAYTNPSLNRYKIDKGRPEGGLAVAVPSTFGLRSRLLKPSGVFLTCRVRRWKLLDLRLLTQQVGNSTDKYDLAVVRLSPQ